MKEHVQDLMGRIFSKAYARKNPLPACVAQYLAGHLGKDNSVELMLEHQKLLEDEDSDSDSDNSISE